MFKKILFFVFLVWVVWNVYANFTYDNANYLAQKSLIVVDKSKVNDLYKIWTRTWAVNLLFSNSWLDYTKYNSALSWMSLSTGTHVKSSDSAYYFLKKAYDPYQVKAKLFLLFEDIFSVRVDRGKDITVQDVQATHDLIYDNMFGSYKTLIKKVLFNGVKWDYSVSEYLDLLNQKNPQNPNENYSRELMQLFLMGKYRPLENGIGKINYTELDVHSLGKILIWLKTISGHKVTFDPNENTNDYVQFLSGSFASGDSFSFVTGENNDIIDIKKIEQSINWNNGLIDNIVDYIFSKRQKSISLFLADKLFRFYVWEHPTKDELNQISQKIIQENFVILPVVKWLLASNIFYNHENDVVFKNPIELMWNIEGHFWIKKSYILDDLSMLNWYPYYPNTIFGRDGFDNNELFFSPSIGLAWTFVSYDFARDYAYNIFNKTTLYLTNFVSNNSIYAPYPFVKNKITFNSNDVAYITWYIDLNNVMISGNILTWWKVLLWKNQVSINWNNLSYDSFKIDFWKMEIYFSGDNIYTGSIDFVNMTRWYTPDEFISYFENEFYINKTLPDSVRNKIIDFLQKNNAWKKVKFDSRDRYKVYAVIWFLLNQPEYILKSWYKDASDDNWGTSKNNTLNNNRLILLRLSGGFDPLSVYVPKKQYKQYKDLRWSSAFWKDELTDFGTGYYIDKNLTGFVGLLNNKDLYVVNRIWVPNHSRWHDNAMYQMSSLNASVSSHNDGILWKYLKNLDEKEWIIISSSYIPAIFRWGKFLWVWSRSYVYNYNNRTKKILENIFSTRTYPANLKWLYDKMLVLNNISNNLYKKTWKYSYSSNNQTKFNYIKELLNQDMWKIIAAPIFGWYDVHSDAKKRMKKVFSEVVWLVSKFYNDVKNNHNVTIVLYSEFWRSLKLNTTAWLDHWQAWTMFIVTNNKKLKEKLKTQFIWNLDFAEWKNNWLGVGIDNRAVWKTILKSLYDIDISNNLSWNIYLSWYLSKTFWNVSNFNRTLRDKYGHIDIKFNLDNLDFIPTEASYLKLEYGQNPNNLFEESQWKLKYYWNNVCKWKTDLWNCNISLRLNNIAPEKKYYYKITLFDNQYNKKVLSWSFVSDKKLGSAPSYILNKNVNTLIDDSSILNPGVLSKKIYLSFTGITSLTGENNIILANSWTYIKEIQTLSWVQWKWWFILPTDLNPDIVLPKEVKINWKDIRTLKIGKLLKVGSDIPWVKMLLNTWVNIVLDGLDTNKKYRLYSSEDKQNWSVHTWLILENWKFIIKTNHFSYYLLVEMNNTWNLSSNNLTNNNTNSVETTSKSNYSWWWGPRLIKDNCPYGDYSESYYDKTCWYDPYYEWAMANVSKSMAYMKRKFRMDLQKYSDEEDDKFHHTLKDLVNLKLFNEIAEKVLSKLIKTKYIWNYKLLYIDSSKYEKYNKAFEKLANYLISRNYKRSSVKTPLIDKLDSFIIYFAVYKEEPKLRQSLKPIIIKKIKELVDLYNENLVKTTRIKLIKKQISYKSKKQSNTNIVKQNNKVNLQETKTKAPNIKKASVKPENTIQDNDLYSIAVHSIWLKADPYWRKNVWILYQGDIIKQLTLLHKKWFFKVEVIKSKNFKLVWEQGYIFRKYLRKMK